MPRHARLRIAGLPLHVIQRGNNRARCFIDDRDRERYLGLLGELAPKFDCSVHAYVLMTNHVHLLLTPERADGSSLLMKNLGQRFVQQFNRTHHRTGTLWEGRFHSCIVDSDAYLLRCHVYIESNPERAGMVRVPGEYPWSSHAFNAHGAPSTFLAAHEKYRTLGDTPGERMHAYQTLFGTKLTDEELQAIRDATNSGYVLGDKSFEASIERQLKCRVGRGTDGRPPKPTPRVESVPLDGKPGSVPGFERKRGPSPV